MYMIFSFAVLALIVFSLVDAITSREDHVKHLPKFGWIILIVLLPLIGSLAWLIAGKDRAIPATLGSFGDPRRAETMPTSSSTTEQELAAIEREIEFHEKQEKLRRLEAEVERKKQGRSQS
jgi:hypothetical protein